MDLFPSFFFYLLLFLLFSFSSSYFTSPPSTTTPIFCHHHEAAALLHFKHSFHINNSAVASCGGYRYDPVESYPKTMTWKEGTSCCQWEGVTCDNVTGHVVGLDLSCSQLYGSFPPNSTLFTLQHLQSLNLGSNYFNGSTISLEFSQLTALKHLNLSDSSFYGEIPSIISHLSSLVSLDLSFNFELTMEKETFKALTQNVSRIQELFLNGINIFSIEVGLMANLSSGLTSLGASGCFLRGRLPESVFSQPQLKYIDLRFNFQLTGKLPDSIGKSKSLNYLDLFDCNFSGPIPKSLGNLSQLVFLALAANNFSADQLLLSLTNLTRLEQLSLSGCRLSGSIPDHDAVFPNLMFLYLGGNYLTGKIPSWLYGLPQLTALFLFDNQFTGHIQNFHSTKLRWINLRGNKLQGSISSSIYEQNDLLTLDLSSNNLSGVVHLTLLSKLQNLTILDLGHNLLTLTGSASLTLPNLQTFGMSSCGMDEFPIFLKGTNNLGSSDLSNNRIRHIPEWMFDVWKDSLYSLNLSYNFIEVINRLPWQNLAVLDFKSNSLQGVLPQLPLALCWLSVSNNNLFGEMSSSICNLTSLEILDMSHNKFDGTIPDCLVNSSNKLSVLNLGWNSLSGTIPAAFSKGCQLENLSLNDNLLEGSLPASISHCKALKVLNLGTNHLNDSFPNWVETLPELQVLILRSNKFHGFFRISARHKHPFHKLQILDLSNNQFSGPIPKGYMKNLKSIMDLDQSLGSLKYMQNSNEPRYDYSMSLTIKGLQVQLQKVLIVFTSIDLSGNIFYGEIPKDIGMLRALKGLNLSHNTLSAQIPSSFGNLKNFEWLDVSSNKLIGQIPKELAELTFLSVLNLSSNQLTGPIPQGKQFNTFSNNSYVGNEELSGFPLSKQCSNSKAEAPQAVVLQQEDDSEHQSAIEWKAVLMGYGCGVSFGISVAHFVFKNGDPNWFLKLVGFMGIKRRPDHRTIRRC